MNANNGFCTPKNNIDHKLFKTNCVKKIVMAGFLFLILFVHIRYNEIPIKIYKVVHTGPNIQLGGLKLGLIIVENQLFTPVIVKKEPINPAKRLTNIDIINFNHFFILFG